VSIELVPRLPEVVLIEDASDSDDMDPPARQSTVLSSMANPHEQKGWS
jgi:hypothetical protein